VRGVSAGARVRAGRLRVLVVLSWLRVAGFRVLVVVVVVAGGLVPARLASGGAPRPGAALLVLLSCGAALAAVLAVRSVRTAAGLDGLGAFGSVVLSAGVSLGAGAGFVVAALWSRAWWAGALCTVACLLGLLRAARWNLPQGVGTVSGRPAAGRRGAENDT